jgi:hypothetical protein
MCPSRDHFHYAIRSLSSAAHIAILLSTLSVGLRAQNPDPLALVKSVVANEDVAYRHRPICLYTSDERSDRTGGHLWEEHVADVAEGKLRYLVAEDGVALSAARRGSEAGRLRRMAANPQAFLSEERSRKDDEQHALRMFDLLPRAFRLEWLPSDGQWFRVAFSPDPSYVPRTYEERVLHGMSGTVLIDRSALRLHQLEGKLAADVSFGFGILAVVHSGSSFSITRDQIAPGVWKTTATKIDVEGRAVFFKTIARKEEAIHKDFEILPASPSIAGAVDRLLR